MRGVYPHTKFEVDRAHRKRDMEDLIFRGFCCRGSEGMGKCKLWEFEPLYFDEIWHEASKFNYLKDSGLKNGGQWIRFRVTGHQSSNPEKSAIRGVKVFGHFDRLRVGISTLTRISIR